MNKTDRRAPSLSGRTIFITGANGFIGRALSARLRTLGAAVKGVDLTADPENDVIASDITKPARFLIGRLWVVDPVLQQMIRVLGKCLRRADRPVR